MKTRGKAVGFRRGRDAHEISVARPRCPLGLDYRQIGVEHFFVGGFKTLHAEAQRELQPLACGYDLRASREGCPRR